VAGSLELQSLTAAEIVHSIETTFSYGEHSVSDGDSFQVGHLRLRTIYTPGHTNDSVCYAVYDGEATSDPFMLFTGDTLFVGGIGRTDLLGRDLQKEQSEKLYDSLYEKVLPLDDGVMIYPAHGAGSICGSNFGNRDVSTIGLERMANHLLNVEMDDFMENMVSMRLPYPPYFKKMEELNTYGPPLLSESLAPKPMGVDDFDKAMHESNKVILDTREPGAFAGSHIPGSYSIWLDGVSYHPGWVLNYGQDVLLVTERREDVETARDYLCRLGFDRVAGYLCTGMRGWRDIGRDFGHLGTLSVSSLKAKLDQSEILLIDVREEREWNEGHIEGAERIYVGQLEEEADRLPRAKPMATICSWGGRGSLGASILKKKGFNEVFNVLGGMRAWYSKGYPVEKNEHSLHQGSEEGVYQENVR